MQIVYLRRNSQFDFEVKKLEFSIQIVAISKKEYTICF